jgi:hypothetical protein
MEKTPKNPDSKHIETSMTIETTCTNELTSSDDDVVCGRGKGFELFPLVINNFDQSLKSTQILSQAKRQVARTRNRNSFVSTNSARRMLAMRFVKRCKHTGGGWKVLFDDDEIRLKIGHALSIDVESLRKKLDRRKLHRMRKKNEIKRAMVQDDLKNAIYVAKDTKDFQSIDSIRSISFSASSPILS